MRTISAGLLMMLAVGTCGWSFASLTKQHENVMLEIAVTDDGTIYVATDKGIIKKTVARGSYSEDDIEEITQAPGIKSLRAFKQSIFYVRDGELLQLPSKKLATTANLIKAVGTTCSIHSVAFDANGQLYLLVTNEKHQAGVVRRNQQGSLSLVIPPGSIEELKQPVCMTVAGETSLLIQCEGQKQCNLVCLIQKKVIGTIALGNVKSVAFDYFGRLFAVDTVSNSIVVQSHAQDKVRTVSKKGDQILAFAYDPQKNCLQAINAGSNTVVAVPASNPTHPVDESPLPLKVSPAFPNIEWTGWEPVNDKGVAVPLRPVLLTHANDQSGRTFVGTEHGVVHVFPNSPDVKATKVFLDLQDKVSYKDSQNEEGFLGLAFHPKYKQNGEFFVNYTKKPGLLTVVSRFKVSKDDPNKADPASEEVLFTLKKPMWNHSGGTICFGPDGYLYIVFGDGGGANDMFKNSRKMDTFHSKIIRIDVDSKSDGKAYGIPKDNPFVGKQGFAPEIFCYGVRNPWRMSFDRKTGQGWFADVGQNLYEEVNLLQKGGDYGWNPRESFHPFGANSLPVNDKMIEPIWEYNHIVGKSITGGHVYRGKQLPELDGYYLYADYVSARIWGLKYDFDQKRVTANREIDNRKMPIMSFGEDENGEVYLLTFSASGQGIDRVVRK